jgi:hypothetical protein
MPTGALGRSTRFPGLSCARRSYRQYANDLKWPIRPPQASPHHTPQAADATPSRTHTHKRAQQTRNVSHRRRRACNRTRCLSRAGPARTWVKDRRALGRLCDSRTMIPRRQARTPRVRAWTQVAALGGRYGQVRRTGHFSSRRGFQVVSSRCRR